jgi:hypothetical protein
MSFKGRLANVIAEFVTFPKRRIGKHDRRRKDVLRRNVAVAELRLGGAPS